MGIENDADSELADLETRPEDCCQRSRTYNGVCAAVTGRWNKQRPANGVECGYATCLITSAHIAPHRPTIMLAEHNHPEQASVGYGLLGV